jgi:prolyl 4-hydroxylase
MNTPKQSYREIEDITGVPDACQEYLQLLKYTEGQFYGQHHDYIKHLADREEGVRALLPCSYISMMLRPGKVEPSFPLLGNLTVMPKKGRALIWPSVLDEDPNAKERSQDRCVRTLSCEKGIRNIGANSLVAQS